MAAPAAVPIKECSKCGEVKPCAEFPRQARAADGLNPWCRECHRVWSRANRERRRELARRRYEADPGRHRAYAEAWRDRNRQQTRDAARAYYEQHRAECLERARQYRNENREAMRERSRARYAANPAIHRLRAERRYEVEKATRVALAEAVALLLQEPCAYCGSTDRIEIDHVVPVARGGCHELDNLAPACLPCNRSKGSQLLSEWDGRH